MPINPRLKPESTLEGGVVASTSANELSSETQRLRERVKELESANRQSRLDEISAKHKLAAVQASYNALEIKNEELSSQTVEQSYRDRRYRELFDLAPIGYLSLSSDGIIQEANLAARCFLKSMGVQILGKSFNEYIPASDRDRLHRHLTTKMSSHLSAKIDLNIQLPDGSSHPVMLMTSAMRGRRSLEHCYHVMMVDISEQVQNEKLLRNAKDFLEEMALHDSLTRLPNRTLFRDRLQTLIEHRTSSNEAIAVIYIDLDGFKPVNDSLGHAAGDNVLRAVSAKVQQALNAGDTIARLGGDEFAVIMDKPLCPESALEYAQKITAVIREPIDLDGTTVSISSSAGVSLFPEHAQNFDDLVKRADAAMYRAKQAGKDQVVLFTQQSYESIQRCSLLETSLPHAVSDNQLVLHYQPIYDTNSSEITALEALVRWQHPTLGTVLPSEFIPIAEKSDHVICIGDWVLDVACAQASIWNQLGFNVPVAINVSARQLMKKDFCEKLQSLLQRHSLVASAIELEITETAVLIDHAQIGCTLQQLSEAGHILSIDDFGTGNSSLSRLVNLPVSRFKIDQMFTQNLVNNAQMRSLVESIVHMAHQLELEVVAEGVENRAQAEILIASQCNAMQGFLYCRPEDESQITKRLQANESDPI